MTKKMLHSKIMIFIFIAFVLLFPATINMPDQTQTYSVVLGVGIDKKNDEYEISTQILTSKANQGFLESLQVHSAKGKNILDAVEELSLHLGRISGFGNTSVIVFCEEVAKEGIAEHLDFFLRSKRLNGEVGDALDAHAEGVARIDAAVDTIELKHIGVNHAATEDFHPARTFAEGTALSAADVARDVHLGAGLGEGEVAGA